jgi:uncharacterized membrane protein YphA (DoxX/SURF4 family)
MKLSSKVLLVLLRLAIGWHFFIEGVDKLDSLYTGPTPGHPAFNSAGFLRESSGPLASAFRRQAGDPDQEFQERLEAIPFQEGVSLERSSFHDHMPPALAKDWQDYLARYLDHYTRNPEDPAAAEEARKQLEEEADRKLAHAEVKVVTLLLDLSKDPKDRNEREVPKTYQTAAYKVKESFWDRVHEYRRKNEEIRRLQDQEFHLFGHDTKKDDFRRLKAEAGQLRSELVTELNAPLVDSLQDILTPAQKGRGPMPAAALPRSLVMTNWAVAIGLTLIGAFLLLGLLTRTSCLFGAIFLLMVFLASPPLPWVPEALRSEGHYLFINKNLIEMLALLALMTLPTGRWFGLDSLIYVLMPWRWKTAKPETYSRDRMARAVSA